MKSTRILLLACLLLLLALDFACGLRVLHLTDIHFDPEYQEGAPSNCQHKHQTFRCCVNSSIPKDPTNPAPARKWGEHHCDTPIVLIQSMLDFIKTQGHFDIILWTGDSPPHNSYTITKQQTLENIKFNTELIRSAFPDSTVIPCLGNHAYVLTSQFVPPPASNWLLDPVGDYWSDLLPSAEAKRTWQQGGYFLVRPTRGLLVISLNTLIYDADNLHAYSPKWGSDPMGQFAWTKGVLKQAKMNGEKVWIIGHIPPGGRTSDPSPMSNHKFSKFYEEILTDFGDLITFNLYGHSHFNEFRVISKSDQGMHPLGMIYMSPAATPWLKQNPSVRFFHMDDQQFNVQNYTQYFANIDTQPKHGPLPWSHLYDAAPGVAPYHLPDMSAKSWLGLLNRMQTNQTLFEVYFSNWKSRAAVGHCKANSECAKQMICGQKHMFYTHVEACALL